jgi:hypothetical protein
LVGRERGRWKGESSIRIEFGVGDNGTGGSEKFMGVEWAGGEGMRCRLDSMGSGCSARDVADGKRMEVKETEGRKGEWMGMM